VWGGGLKSKEVNLAIILIEDTENDQLLAFHCQHVDWSSSRLDNCQVERIK
jgi:hypothetical protein